MGTSGIVLLLLVTVCWLGMLMMFPAFVGVEAHGDAGVGVAYGHLAAFAFAGFTWLWIGGLLLIAATRGLLPGWGNLAALVLGPASAVAAMASLYLLSDPHTRWPAVIPVVAPVLLAGYACAVMQPSPRRVFSTPVAGLTVWMLALVLAVAPWPALLTQMRGKAIERAENARARAEWERQERERNRAQNLEKLRNMPPGASIMNWYPLLDPGSGVQAEALDALRHDPSRQAQIEDMLTWGVQRAMTLLPDLDLQPTPALCQAAGTFLTKTATSSHLRKRDDPVPYTAQVAFHELLPGIRWLVSHGCNCDEGIRALDASARTYLDSPDRQQLLADLAALRQH
jgi:uncharacterized membrane protein